MRSPCVLALVWLLAVACAPADPSTATPVAPVRPVAVIAHRGGAALAPENTLAAFRHAVALGVDALEMDSHLSADAVPVIIHDATLERTTDGVGRVSNATLAQLQALNAAAKFAGGRASREPVPSFAAVLELARGSRVQLEVEIKVPPQGRYAGIEERILSAIAERQMFDRVQISSFDFGVLADVKRLRPEARTVALVTGDFFRRVPLDYPERAVAEMHATGAAVIAVNKDYLTPALVQAARARQMAVEVWTVNDESDMIRFTGMGVDGIISDRPDLLRRIAGK